MRFSRGVPTRWCLAVAYSALVVAFSGAGGHLAAAPGTTTRVPWLVEGEVLTAARVGQTLYIGGRFTRVAPAGNALPPVVAVSASTGQVVATLPPVTGRVVRILPDGGGGWFLAGDFVTSSPVRAHLVHVAANGTLDATFDAHLDAPVVDVALVGARLFAIGRGLGGGAGVVALSAGSGAPVVWAAPVAGSFVPRAIAGASDRVVVGGVDATPFVNAGVAIAYDAQGGAPLWRTVVAPGAVGLRGDAWAVSVDGADVFVAHSPTAGNGGLSRLALATGAVDAAWNPRLSPSAIAIVGARVYAGGAFGDVQGGPLVGVAAVERATGTATIFTHTNAPPSQIVPGGAGTLFLAGAFTAAGAYPRHRLAEVDGMGIPTPWMADIGPDAVFALTGVSSGALVVSTSIAATGGIARRNAAAFDLDTGALLPWQPALPSTYGVTFIGGDASRLYISEGLDTLSYDPDTGARDSGPALNGQVGLHAAADGFYTVSVNDCCRPQLPHVLRRHAWADGAEDPAWRPALPLPLAGERSVPPVRLVTDARHVYVAHAAAGVVALDPRTARLRWAAPTPAARLAVSGDTLYALQPAGITALDTRTGQSIGPVGAGGVTAMTLADGHLAVTEPDGAGGVRLAEYRLDGARTTWQPGVGRAYPSTTPDHLMALGNVLVAAGAVGATTPAALQGLAVFDLSGATAPAALRARPAGTATAFTWDPPVPAPAGGYVLEAGPAPGQVAAVLPLGPVTRFSTVVPAGTFYVRVRTAGAAGGVEEVSNEIVVTGGCTAPPAAPARFRAVLFGAALDSATFAWDAPDALVSTYTLIAGSAPGRADVASIPLSGDATGFSYASAIPPGTYFLRVRATNACGTSVDSAELRLTIGAGDLPLAPLGLTLTAAGGATTLSWTPVAGATGHVLEAGSDVGLSDLAAVPLGPAPSFSVPPVPSGVYVLRVRAVNAAGTSAPSNEVVLRVP